MTRTIVTTSWDDGHICDVRLATLLKKYHMKGTFYISPKDRELREQDRLSDEQVRALSGDFEIGAHTMTHPRLSSVDVHIAHDEIVQSKQYLEQVINMPVLSFCYPGGDFTQVHKDIVRDAGFTYARTVERFKSSIKPDMLAAPTTIHAYRHWSDALDILKAVGLAKFFKCYLNWDELAIEVFESVRARGGVFHLWGHSWEIDKNGDWDRLERVLHHISHYNDMRHATNHELVTL